MDSSRSHSESVRSGAGAETTVAALHKECADVGVAWMRKVPTPFRVIRSVRGGVLAVPCEKAGVDYVGHMADGRAVYVEVKLVTGPTFLMSRVKPQQREELTRASSHGALAVLLLICKERPYALPWAMWMCAISIKMDTLAPSPRVYLSEWENNTQCSV
jgi:penicillin-binding protein-related factor A (putative recombinase)